MSLQKQTGTDNIECPHCARVYDTDTDDLKAGDACPSDDCPSKASLAVQDVEDRFAKVILHAERNQQYAGVNGTTMGQVGAYERCRHLQEGMAIALGLAYQSPAFHERLAAAKARVQQKGPAA
jgi:hypothetical protein